VRRRGGDQIADSALVIARKCGRPAGIDQLRNGSLNDSGMPSGAAS
jgi:hypothetical protein